MTITDGRGAVGVKFCHVVVLLLIVGAGRASFAENAMKLANGNWMRDWFRIMPEIKNATLQDITLPGTHDSGSYNITNQLLDVPEYIEEMVYVADQLGVDVSEIIRVWATSQDYNFFQQFVSGIRYVDVRVCFFKGEWRTHHNFAVGNLMTELLNHTRAFISQYREEVIILELSHNFGHASLIQTVEFVDMIESYLGEYLLPKSPGFIPIQDMIASNKRILLSFTDQEAISNRTNIWPGNTIINSYADSPVRATMESYNVAEVAKYSQGRPFVNQLYKLSWTLTPNAETILGAVLPWDPHTLIELANFANVDLQRWFTQEIQPKNIVYPILGNILIIDHFEASPIVSIVKQH